MSIRTTSNHVLPIPNSRTEVTLQFAATLIVVVFTLLGFVNVCSGVALVPSLIWLALVTAMVWSSSREQGGLRRFLITLLGSLFGQRFVESDTSGAPPGDIHFGFDLFGRRFIQKCIAMERIESVEWSTGQATAMAGRDMNDWHVFVWFDHRDPTTAETKRKWGARRPEQDIYGVGSPARKARTEALGMAFIAFLREAGVDLVQGETPTCFVRRTTESGEAKPLTG
jgi:hypothetical protein